MARKSNEKIILEWLMRNKDKFNGEFYKMGLEILEEESPGIFVPKKKGRPKSNYYLNDFHDVEGIFNKAWELNISMPKCAVCLDKLNHWPNDITLKDKYMRLMDVFYFKKIPSYQYFARKYNELTINKPKRNGILPYPENEIISDMEEVLEYLNTLFNEI